ncbi:MAG: hypothetical protein K0R00_685 [Herbinix sp.]|jgi:hypothetical protein|nr:hypothetical protein [Herbinix sp.]
MGDARKSASHFYIWQIIKSKITIVYNSKEEETRYTVSSSLNYFLHS